MTPLLAVLLAAVLPGLGVASLGIAGGEGDRPLVPGSFLLHATTYGVATWLAVSGILEATVGVTAAASWVVDGLAGAAGAVLLVLRRRVLREALPDLAMGAAAGALGVLAWLPVLLVNLGVGWGPIQPTPWYYWNLASVVAHQHHVPATATEWGTSVPFLDDYHLFTTATAGLLTQAPGVGTLHVVMLLATVQLALAAALLATALGVGRAPAFVAAPIAVGTGIGLTKLASYRPEAFGLGLMLLVVACVVQWLRHEGRLTLGAAAAGAAVLWQVHAIAFVVAAILCVAAVLAQVRRGAGWRRLLLRPAGGAVAIVLTALVVRYTIGGTGSAANAGGLADRGGPGDPTWVFTRAVAGQPPSTPPSNAHLASYTLNGAYPSWLGGRAVVVLGGLALVWLLVAAVRDAESRRRLVFLVAALAGLLAMVLVFAVGWQGYVPRRTGTARIVLETTILLGPLVACALAAVPRVGRPARRGRLTWAVVGGVTAVVTVLAGLAGVVRSDILVRQHPSRAELALVRSAIRPQPGTFVLANAYTESYFKQVAGADALLDGRAPYTFPSLLQRSNRLLREAQAFFLSPRRHADFLDRNHVSYVVVTGRRAQALGTSNVFRSGVDQRGIRTSPRLEQVARARTVQVYRVLPPTTP